MERFESTGKRNLGHVTNEQGFHLLIDSATEKWYASTWGTRIEKYVDVDVDFRPMHFEHYKNDREKSQ